MNVSYWWCWCCCRCCCYGFSFFQIIVVDSFACMTSIILAKLFIIYRVYRNWRAFFCTYIVIDHMIKYHIVRNCLDKCFDQFIVIFFKYSTWRVHSISVAVNDYTNLFAFFYFTFRRSNYIRYCLCSHFEQKQGSFLPVTMNKSF